MCRSFIGFESGSPRSSSAASSMLLEVKAVSTTLDPADNGEDKEDIRVWASLSESTPCLLSRSKIRMVHPGRMKP